MVFWLVLKLEISYRVIYILQDFGITFVIDIGTSVGWVNVLPHIYPWVCKRINKFPIQLIFFITFLLPYLVGKSFLYIGHLFCRGDICFRFTLTQV